MTPRQIVIALLICVGVWAVMGLSNPDQRDRKCETIRAQIAAGRVLTASERANAEWNCGPTPGVSR